MRVFIQCDKIEHLPANPNIFNAFEGFRTMGFETIFFETYEDLIDKEHSKEEPIVGYIGMIRRRLLDFGIEPQNIDYPDTLKNYLGRKVWSSTMNKVQNDPSSWPLFVKSKTQKYLTGKVIRSISDLVGCGCSESDFDVYCSEPIKFLAEWRVFVRYGEIIGVKHYNGRFDIQYDFKVIENAVKDYTDCPNAYGIDFGVTEEGRTLLIEVNDAFALGSYGLPYYLYAKLLITRWAEMTDTFDEFYYI